MQTPIDVADAGERRVVVLPHDPDIQERRQVGDVGRPLLQQTLAELARRDVRDTQVEHQQGDHDGVHGVTERFDAAGVRQPGEALLGTCRCAT